MNDRLKYHMTCSNQNDQDLETQLLLLQSEISSNDIEAERISKRTSDLRRQTKQLEIEIHDQETVLDSTDKLSLELETKYQTLCDKIPNLEREIADLESIKSEIAQELDFQSLLSSAQKSNAILTDQLQDCHFRISENKEKLKAIEYENDHLITQFQTENETAINLQSQLNELELTAAQLSQLFNQKETFLEQQKIQFHEIQKLKRECKNNSVKLRRQKKLRLEIFPETRKLKSRLSECNAQLKMTKRTIIDLHQQFQTENTEIYEEYEELIAPQRLKIANLRQLKKNFRIEVAALHTIVDRLVAQQLSIREVVSKQAIEIDELKMRLRINEEKARLERVFHQKDRNRMLSQRLANIERNHNEIASLFEQNQSMRQQMFGTEHSPKRLRTRIFTNHLARKQQLRRY
jgi:chromosome segregation ATPase